MKNQHNPGPSFLEDFFCMIAGLVLMLCIGVFSVFMALMVIAAPIASLIYLLMVLGVIK